MTISSQTFRWAYTAIGAASTLYPYTNKILSEDDLAVYVNDVLLTIGTDYSVTGVRASTGGSVSFVVAPTAGASVLITKDGIDFTQETDYVENDSFPAQSHEDALDKLTNLAQKIWDYTRRSIKLAITSTLTDLEFPTPEAGKSFAWNGTATGIENITLAGTGAISDTAYNSATWDSVTDIAPSKNAVREIIESRTPGFDALSYGTTLTQATIEAALTAIKTPALGGPTCTLLFRPGTWVISSNADWSTYTNVTFKIVPGAIISRGAFTVNIPNPDAGLYQWLSGTGAVTFSGNIKEVYPEWFATNTTPGTTDMTTAIQAAHDTAVLSGYSNVVFGGQYLFTTLTWSPHVGARTRGKTYLKTANAAGRTIQVSDEYGRPATYGLNSPRNTVFDGQFYLVNTNGANTAIAWTFGGLTNSYYCNLVTALRGVETRYFYGGLYEFRYNAFLIDFESCFDYDNGARIIIADPVTNTGEGIRFISTTFSASSYLMDVNSVHAYSFDFIGCSADYMLGLNKPGNSAPLVSVNWMGGHLEWDTVAAAYLQNDAAMTWNIDGAMVAPTALVGWPTYTISETTGAGTTRFTNIKYVIPGTMNTLHRLVSATSRGVFDYSPNYQGGNTPGGLVVYADAATVGFDGITARELTYTPVWSGTLGNGTLIAKYTRIANRVDLSIKLTWGATTSHGAAVQTFSLPYTVNATYPGLGSFWANDYGTGNRTGTVRAAAGAAAILLYDDATAGQVSNAVPMTWAVNDSIELEVTYFVD